MHAAAASTKHYVTRARDLIIAPYFSSINPYVFLLFGLHDILHLNYAKNPVCGW